MPLLLKEFEGYDIADSSKYSNPVLPMAESGSKKNLKESYTSDHANDYVVTIEAMHCYPYATGNDTRYMPQAAKASLGGWTDPYERPTIMYHNDYDGVVNGRIKEANMAYSAKTNSECLVLKASAPGWSTRDDLDSGILKTVSIGVSGTDVRCSICGSQLSDGEFCEHQRGEIYDGEKCYWDVYAFEPKELSYVIVPSDRYAQVVSIENKNDAAVVRSFNLSNSKESQANNKNLKIQEHLANGGKTTERTNTMDEKDQKLADTLKLNENLRTSVTALQGDKLSLTEQITALNKDKIALHDEVKTLKEQVTAKETQATQEKELREAQETENTKLKAEIKATLVDTLAALREKAGKGKLEKLDERSIDSLRDSITDLKTEIELAAVAGAKGSVEGTDIKEDQSTPGTKDNTQLKESEDEGHGLSL